MMTAIASGRDAAGMLAMGVSELPGVASRDPVPASLGVRQRRQHRDARRRELDIAVLLRE